MGDLEGSPQDVEEMPGELISHFEQLINQSPTKIDTPHLILAINNLGDYSDEMLAWLSGSFNSGIRKSKAFKGCRFIFTSEQVSERENTFFDSFGFEKVHVVEIEANNPKKGQTSTKLVENNSNIIGNAPSGSSHHQGSISPKPLKKNALPCKLIGLGNIDRMDLKDAAEKLLSPFNEEEKGHLFLASYPTRISRYSLEHFESYCKAALCFNWLKEQASYAMWMKVVIFYSRKNFVSPLALYMPISFRKFLINGPHLRPFLILFINISQLINFIGYQSIYNC